MRHWLQCLLCSLVQFAVDFPQQRLHILSREWNGIHAPRIEHLWDQLGRTATIQSLIRTMPLQSSVRWLTPAIFFFFCSYFISFSRYFFFFFFFYFSNPTPRQNISLGCI